MGRDFDSWLLISEKVSEVFVSFPSSVGTTPVKEFELSSKYFSVFVSCPS